MDIPPPPHPARPTLDGRWVTAAMLLGYAVLLGTFISMSDYYGGWRDLGVPSLQPYFADMRDITAAADSFRLGYDPLVRSPENPYGVPMDYPRLWLQAALALGLHQRDTVWLGGALAVAFFTGVFLFMGRVGFREGAFWGLLLCAPPVMLAVERGNNDLLIFLLLAGALLAVRRQDAPSWPALLAIFLGGLLKLFPIVALMLAWREPPRRALTILGTAAAAFAGYLYAVRADLRAINAAVPRALGCSYGSRVYFYGIADSYPAAVPWVGWTVLAVAMMVLGAGLARWRWPGPAPLPRAETDGLLVGGAVYTITFIVGSSYNYRLVMLLFAVPALLRLAHGSAPAYRRLALTLLAAMAVGWLCSAAEKLTAAFFVKEAANWTVCGGMLFLLLQQLPLPGRNGARAEDGSDDRSALTLRFPPAEHAAGAAGGVLQGGE